MTISLERYQASLGAIYDAALDARLWPRALAAVAAVLEARATDLVLVDPRSTSGVQTIPHNLPTETDAIERFVELAPVNPRLAYTLANPTAAVLDDSLFIDEEAMRQSEFYDWLEKAAGVRYHLGTSAMTEGRSTGAFQRTGRARMARRASPGGLNVCSCSVHIFNARLPSAPCLVDKEQNYRCSNTRSGIQTTR